MVKRISAFPRDATLGTALAAGLAILAFTTTGGFDPIGARAGDTWAEIAIMLLGAGAVAATVLTGTRGRHWGGATVALFAALAALTAASIAWSVQPDYSWQDAGQTLAYLAAFAAAAALARLYPARWPTLVGALAAAAAGLSAYALLAKVFPAALDAANPLGRLAAPFGYWNATGVTAAVGLGPCLWVGARHERTRVLRALSVPAIALLISVVVLSFSRSAVLAAVLAVGVWLACVPLRLRACALLALGGVGGGVITGWALSTAALSSDRVSLSARTTAGHSFGLVLLVTLTALAAAAFVAVVAIDRTALSAGTRRRLGSALVIFAAIMPAGGLVAVAFSPRGLTGEISHVWHSLTSTRTAVGDSAGRLAALGNTRPLYWSEGIKVGEHALLKGVGGEAFATARTAYTATPAAVNHAHSYVIQTFADLGLIGIAINLALLVAWAIAAARPLAPRTSWASLTGAQRAEREGAITLAVVVLAFGIQSAVDWTWFFTAVAVPALLAAGWLAGRGPLASPARRAAEPRPLRQRPGAAAAVTALAAVALLGAWITWQPLRSAQAVAASLDAAAHRDTGAAVSYARDAADVYPVSIEPLDILSALYTGAGDSRSARAELVQAARRQPNNYETWLGLGQFDLQQHQPRRAFGSLLHSLALNRTDGSTITLVIQARTELGIPPPKP